MGAQDCWKPLALYSNFAPLFPSPRVGEMCRPVLVASVVTVALLELASASLRGSGNHSVVGNMTSMQGQDLVCPTWLSPHFAEALPYYDKQPKFGTYSCSGMVTAAAKYGIKFDDSDAWNTGATKGEGMDRVQRFRDLLAKLNVPIPDVVASWSAENPACKPPPQCFCPAPHSTWSCNPDKPSKWMCGATSPWAQCVCH